MHSETQRVRDFKDERIKSLHLSSKWKKHLITDSNVRFSNLSNFWTEQDTETTSKTVKQKSCQREYVIERILQSFTAEIKNGVVGGSAWI